MKVLTLNFMTCAVKACKGTAASYPLHLKDVELVQDELELNPDAIINILPRLDWAALKTTSTEVRHKNNMSILAPLNFSQSNTDA